ncbi:salicylate/benzoate carboxyl methyltransferase-like [Triticum aestivum]|uniref:salicylate/benzoate carboxyl methyltransferase-like n=1 Tax=Triticum aestivum TaxID=4565 RepID=UPI001D027729|nr:salicylate/benzoate carboxyl methyltransferase-like [Triticum aestivum]
MNQGQGKTSYARNSGIQNAASALLPTKMVVADLGCSSGPNAVALVSIAIDAIHIHCLQFLQPPPEVCVLLNDLPDNDFNTVVKSLVTLHQSNNEPIVATGIVPGSFYERLFTSGSLHLVCSSNSLDWLSKAPEDLTRNQIPAYDIDEHTRLERHPMVIEAYAQQFRKDFRSFLKFRAKELIPGGRIVVSLVGDFLDSGVIAPKFSHMWEFIAQILSVMVSEGVIDKAKFDSFYVPFYEPSDKELREIIQDEGSFSISEMRVHGPQSGVDSALMVPRRFVNTTRAVFEPIIVLHFGEVMDEFVRTLERRWSVEGIMQDDFTGSPRPRVAVSSRRHDLQVTGVSP